MRLDRSGCRPFVDGVFAQIFLSLDVCKKGMAYPVEAALSCCRDYGGVILDRNIVPFAPAPHHVIVYRHAAQVSLYVARKDNEPRLASAGGNLLPKLNDLPM